VIFFFGYLKHLIVLIYQKDAPALNAYAHSLNGRFHTHGSEKKKGRKHALA
jgi:hypothetical protein